MFCEICGAKIEDECDFCKTCGTKIKNYAEVKCNYYPVDVKRADNSIKFNKTKKLSQSKIKLVAIISLALIIFCSGIFYITDKILHPELIRVLVKPSLDYDGIAPCGEGLLSAYTNEGEKVGLINKRGEIVAPLIYDPNPVDFIDGLVYMTKDGKGVYLDKNGNTVIELDNGCGSYFYDGLASVSNNGKYGYINKSGETAIPLIYDYAGDFNGGAAQVSIDNKWGLINQTGDIIVPFDEYDIIFNGGDGFFEVRKGDKVGLINQNGEVIIPPEYFNIMRVQAGLFRANKIEDEKWGYIDITGKIVIPLKYKSAGEFHDGFAWCELFNRLLA